MRPVIILLLLFFFSSCSTAYGEENIASQSSLKRYEIDRTTTGIGITPSEYMNIARGVCKNGYQVFINLIYYNNLIRTV